MNLNGLFSQETVDVAQSLLGCILIHTTSEGTTFGMIVETEAYLHNDPASHSFKGKTPRNSVMFGPPGRAYIYFTYGMHYCFNIVTNKEGIGEAVLIRALQPIKGIHLMQQRRGIQDIKQLCNGPAKLVQALGITKAYNGLSLIKGPLRILVSKTKEPFSIERTQRIGITNGVSLPLRFTIKSNAFISRG